MRYKCTNISLYQTISNKIRLKIGRAKRKSTNSYDKWTEKSNCRNN